EGATPFHQFGLRSYIDLPYDLQFDAQLRSVTKIRSMAEAVEPESIPGYTELDVRLGWPVRDDLTLSVIGQNLLDNHHPEFGTERSRGEIERAVFAKVTYRH